MGFYSHPDRPRKIIFRDRPARRAHARLTLARLSILTLAPRSQPARGFPSARSRCKGLAVLRRLRRPYLAFAAVVLFAACAPAAEGPTRTPDDNLKTTTPVPTAKPATESPTASSADAAVNALSARFLEGYLKLEPVRSTDA